MSRRFGFSISSLALLLAVGAAACEAAKGAGGSADGDSDTDTDTDTDADTDTDTDSDSDTDSDTEIDTDTCDVPADEFGSVDECTETAPPDSFEPDVQWEWTGPDGYDQSYTTPLVANLTDDDESGRIDLCDTPDIVVGVVSSVSSNGRIYVFDGATGAVHYFIEQAGCDAVTPALGDIDFDGVVEIVSASYSGTAQAMAYENDGTLKWTSDPWPVSWAPDIGSIALADLENDGDVEIVIGCEVLDHEGTHLWSVPAAACDDTAFGGYSYRFYSATAIADLDGDGDQEIVLGHAAYHHDGTEYYLNDEIAPSYPQVADLDGDGLPEVLATNGNGISVLENDGTVKYKDLRPTGMPVDGYGTNWKRPATIHDFDGDGDAEFATSSAAYYTVYEADASIVWSSPVTDSSGVAAGTAFDFLGDGMAEAMYADETKMFIFDEAGDVLLESTRTSRTIIEYPVVADVDNDGSAEIVVVSNEGYAGPASPTVQVIRDVEDRWIQARRIWNQHTYHVTNVREDGTIPQYETPSWELFNTFRTNIQIENGGLCDPPIE